MKVFNLFLLLYPSVAVGQTNYEMIKEQAKQKGNYEYVYDFENYYAVFRTFDDKVGVVDTNGNVIIKPVYAYIYNKGGLKGFFEVGNKVNKKFKRGFIDIKENVKIPIIYDDVFYVRENLIRVVMDDKFGVIDTLNNTILPIKFDYVACDNDLIITRLDDIWRLYDYAGELASDLEFKNIPRFIDKKAIVTLKNESTAIIDNHGRILLEPIPGHSFHSILKDSLFLVKNISTGKMGVLNSKRDFVIKCGYDALNQVGIVFVAENNHKQGIISLADTVLKPFVYDNIYPCYFKEPGTYGDIHPVEYFIVRKGTSFGVINPHEENDIIPIVYKEISTIFGLYFIVLNRKESNGVYFKNGEKILNEEYKIYNVFNKTLFASNDNKLYLIELKDKNYSETEVLGDEYFKFKDQKDYSYNENQIFKLNGKYGVVNYKNNIVIPAEFDQLENIQYTKEFIVKKNNKYGIINDENRIVESIEYDQFQVLHETVLLAKQNQKSVRTHDILFDEIPPPITH